MKGDPKFIVLKYSAWLDASKFETAMLGAVVRNPLSPTTDYVPDHPLRYNKKDLIEGSLPNFLISGSNTSSTKASAALSSVVGFSWEGNKDDTVHLAGKLLRYKRLQQHENFWELLRADPMIRARVPGWISFFNTWPPCLVVGIMTAEDVELDYSGATERQMSGELQLPLAAVSLAAVGTPALCTLDGANPSATAALDRQVATIFKARSSKNSIFALELRAVTTKGLRGRELALKEGGPKVDEGRLADNEESSEDEQDDYHPLTTEDLIIVNFTNEEYGDLIG